MSIESLPSEDTRILVVDTDLQTRRLLKVGLEKGGYEVLLAASGEHALDSVAVNSPQVVILELDLPILNGFEVCRELREWSKVPIIVSSTRPDEEDKIRALDLGADDYVVKPFGIGEMLARIRAVLRRTNVIEAVDAPVFECGDLRIDFAKRIVKVAGKEIHLTPKEYNLLRFMVTNSDRLLTSRQLLALFWSSNAAEDSHTLRVHVANLRKKVEKDPENPRFILTETRLGYRFKTDADSNNCSVTHKYG